MKENKPNFLLIGAPKAGTTSISRYLAEHPEIFISEEKEPFYFIAKTVNSISENDPMLKGILEKAHLSKSEYYGLFENVNDEKRIGECTVHYLFHYDEVIPRVKEELGDIPLVLVLRNPAERAFSNYKYQSKTQIISFEEALLLEEERKTLGFNSFWYYKEVGKYYKPVRAYLENFSKVYVCFFEDLKDNPESFMKEIFKFLEVDDKFSPNFQVRHNPTLVPKNRVLQALYFFKNKHQISFMLPKRVKEVLEPIVLKKNKSKMNSKTNKELKLFFKEDVKKLENLLKKDLRKWYEF